MELFQKILKIAIDGAASDVHLKIGTPVIFRINRELIAVECPFPTADWMNKIVATITPEHLKKRLEEDREIDFSYFIPGLGRFRTNLFQQRGQWALAMRHVKTNVPSFAQLGLLEQIASRLRNHRAASCWVAGSTGSGKSTTLAAMLEHATSTVISKSTSSRSVKTRLNSFLRTTSASSNSGKSASTRNPFIMRSKMSCARIRTSSCSAKCATR